jgi:hypothetical protein
MNWERVKKMYEIKRCYKETCRFNEHKTTGEFLCTHIDFGNRKTKASCKCPICICNGGKKLQ